MVKNIVRSKIPQAKDGRPAPASVAIIEARTGYLSAVWGIKDLLDDAEVPESRASLTARGSSTTEVFVAFAESRYRHRDNPAAQAGQSVRCEARQDMTRRSGLVHADRPRGEAAEAIVCSVCAGAFYLCAAGIADGRLRDDALERLASALEAAFPERDGDEGESRARSRQIHRGGRRDELSGSYACT